MKAAVVFTACIGAASAWVTIPWYNPVQGTPAWDPPVRRDIDDLQRNYPEQFHLYVHAMAEFQTKSVNDLKGYYQIAGIHGAPHITYDDNSGNSQQPILNSNNGYCWHGSQNFVLWHRPYLTLYEIAIREIATRIANSWEAGSRARYQRAASTLRVPYWDWAKGPTPGRVPDACRSSTISIPNPSTNQQRSIRNPLYSHTVVTGPNSNVGWYQGNRQWPIYLGDTSRGAPNRGTTYRANGYERAMESVGPGMQRQVALLLNTPNLCYNVFATYDTNEHRQCSSRGAVTSLEGIHNTVHNTVGGTMANLEISSWDPIFWLHHTNVDRVAALWTWLNWWTYVQPTDSDSTTRTNRAGERQDATQKYYPFRWTNTNSGWWEPRWLYDCRTSGYTYPELAGYPSGASVLRRVQQMYGTGRTQQNLATGNSAKRLKQKRGDFLNRLRARADPVTPPTNLTIAPPIAQLEEHVDTLIGKDGSFDEFIANITVNKKYASQGYDLHLFFGNPAKSSKISHSYLEDPKRIGGVSVLGAPNMSMDKQVSSYIDITDALLKLFTAGIIKDLKPRTVQRYCRAKLVYRIVTQDGQDIGREARNRGIKVKVIHQKVKPPPKEGEKPKLEAPTEIVDSSEKTSAAPIPTDVVGTATIASGAAAATGVA